MTEAAPQVTFQIDILIFDEYEGQVSGPRLKGIVERALAMEEVPASAAIDVVVADDETVRELNGRHRGLDETTDVLSFSYVDEGKGHGPGDGSAETDRRVEFVLPPGYETGLGEVVVSYPQASRQAAEQSHSTERELEALVTHGVLHLLGYDHEEVDERAEMQAREARVLSNAADRE